jgi:outer membrane protein assembly factor BamD
MVMEKKTSRPTLGRVGTAALCVLLLMALSGCNFSMMDYYFGDLFGRGKKPDKPPQQLAVEGVQKMQQKDYGDALKAFRTLKERYPYSKYAILAELKVADAHFLKGQYPEAAVAYEEFVRLHPRNDIVPYILYQIGMCHFLSFRATDRDQDETKLAMESFQRLVQAFPQSEYSQRAKKQLLECTKRLAYHEYHIAKFYFGRDRFEAAKVRLDKLTSTYPDATRELGLQKDVEKMQASCDRRIAAGGNKPSIWIRMGF